MGHIDRIRRKKRRVRIGSLNKKIFLAPQTIVQSTPGTNFDSDISTGDYVWAMVNTIRGEIEFDGTSIVDNATHAFTIRFRPMITQEYMVAFEGKNYNIIDIEDYDERHQFMVLKCTERGLATEEVNRA